MSRLASELHRLRRSPWEVLWSALVSCGLVLFSQLAVAIVPRLLPSISLLAMLPVAGLVFLATIVVGRLWRRFIGVGASAPLFVLFNVLFLWGVYIFVIRRDTSSLLDMLINAECALLLWGLYRILSGDPGIVAYESSFLEEAGCKDFVDAICSSEKHPSLSRNPLSLNMVIGAMLFSVLQVLWQVVFLIWHVYGICFNIKTDEWVMSNFPCFGLFLHQLQVACSFAVSYS